MARVMARGPGLTFELRRALAILLTSATFPRASLTSHLGLAGCRAHALAEGLGRVGAYRADLTVDHGVVEQLIAKFQEERRSVMTSVVENREEQVEGTEETGIMREVEQGRVEHTIQGEAEEATGLVGVARGNSREEGNLGAEEQRVVEGEMTTKGSRKKVEKQGVDVVAVAEQW